MQREGEKRGMGGFETPFSLSSLLCQEDESCLIEQEFTGVNFDSCLSESEIEYVHFLIKKETEKFQSNSSLKSSSIDCSEKTEIENESASFQSNSSIDSSSIDCSRKTENWLKGARLDAIKWILNARLIFGFHFRTAYLSLTYLDQFISRQTLVNGQEWVIRLGSVASLSLAAKMEERYVPALSRYKMDDYYFEGKVIKRMELMVLDTLGWEMGSVTPFAYLRYFISKFCGGSKPEELNFRAMELILAIVEDINLVDYRPSVVAAAVVLAAYNGNLTRDELESKISEIPSWGCLEREHIHSCYKLMQEIEMMKSNSPVPRNLLQNRSTSSDTLGNSSIKRQLTFNECDENCPIQKIRRQLK